MWATEQLAPKRVVFNLNKSCQQTTLSYRLTNKIYLLKSLLKSNVNELRLISVSNWCYSTCIEKKTKNKKKTWSNTQLQKVLPSSRNQTLSCAITACCFGAILQHLSTLALWFSCSFHSSLVFNLVFLCFKYIDIDLILFDFMFLYLCVYTCACVKHIYSNLSSMGGLIKDLSIYLCMYLFVICQSHRQLQLRQTNWFSLFSALFSISGDDCESYRDNFNVYQPSKSCKRSFCCGDCKNRYCCNEYYKHLSEFKQDAW